MNSIYKALTHTKPRLASLYATASAYRTTKYPPSSKKASKVATEPQPKSEAATELLGSKEWKRPSEIPYQPKIVNSVNIIGYVHSPVSTFTMVDSLHGFAAFTLLSHTKHPNSLRIPIFFEGDLAHIAACHLKENDCIYIAGHLTPLSTPIDVHQTQDQVNFQVVVQNINFVEKPSKTKNISATFEQEEAANSSDIGKDEISGSRNDLIFKSKGTPKGAAFERETNGEILIIDDSTPKQVQQEVESITCDRKPLSQSEKASVTKQTVSGHEHWRELIDNPKQWRDFRSSKDSGSVKPKHPDFKHKDSGIALWLNSAPGWVLSKLEELVFDVPVLKSGQQNVKKSEESWKALVENPNKWWDNRVNKKNAKAPDFKHKDTGEALWLTDSPAWVQQKLSPPKEKQGADGWGGNQLSGAS